MATQTEIITDITEGALRDLTVIASTETPSGEDSDFATARLDQIIEELRTKDEVTFGDIPVWAIRPLRQMLAGDMVEAYGVPDTIAARAMLHADRGLRSLRSEFTEKKNINDPAQVSDF